MSNEGEWTTVTSKHSAGHKPQRPLSTVSAAAPASSTSKTDSRATNDKSAGTNKSGHSHNHHHYHHKKQVKKDAPATSSAAASTSQKDGAPKATSGKQPVRARSGSVSSDSDSSQSDEPSSPTSAGRSPYHTLIVIHCPFDSCDLTDPFTDSTSLVNHLKETHKIVFKNIHHMFILLERYLNHWGKEIEAKGIDKVAVKENEGDEYYTIDPAVSVADRTLRDEIQREKLNEILRVQEKERNEEAKQKRKCLFCKNICENRQVAGGSTGHL
jgi:hypothetical protein